MMVQTAAELAGFKLKLQTEDDYFVGTIPGMVRVGLAGCISTDFPIGHSLYDAALNLTEKTVEEFFDAEVISRH